MFCIVIVGNDIHFLILIRLRTYSEFVLAASTLCKKSKTSDGLMEERVGESSNKRLLKREKLKEYIMHKRELEANGCIFRHQIIVFIEI